MSILLQFLAGLYVLAVTLIVLGLAYFRILDAGTKTDAEVTLLEAQTDHIRQTAAAEALNSEALKTSYEKQGANKLRTEIARIGDNLDEVEKKLGVKLKGAISVAAHEVELAKSRVIILELEDRLLQYELTIAKLSPVVADPGFVSGNVPTPSEVYSGQPSPGAGIVI